MDIVVDNIYCTVKNYTDEQLDRLDGLLSVSVPRHEHMPKFKAGLWDGKRHFFSATTKRFLTGLLPFVLSNFEKRKDSIRLFDARKNISIPDPTVFHARYPNARPYQIDTLRDVFTNTLRFRDTVLPWHRGVVQLDTGAGKTYVAACMIDFLKRPTLYLVERKSLAHQTKKDLAKVVTGDIGIIGDGLRDYGMTTIGIIQTLKHYKNSKEFQRYLETVDVVIIDECHHVASSGTYHDLLTRCKAPFRFGLSATPLRRSDLGDITLIGDTGDILTTSNRAELEADGYLSKPIIYMFGVKNPINHSLTYRNAYAELIVNNTQRNEMVISAAKKLHDRKLTVLILFREITHGKLLFKAVKKILPRTIYLDGKSPQGAREDALSNLGAKYDCIVASSIFDEGVDATKLDAVVLAGGGSSDIKTVQRIGRISRPKNGVSKCYAVDFIDQTNPHLLRHSSSRLQTYQDQKFTVKFPPIV